jgi:hypothetical protein
VAEVSQDKGENKMAKKLKGIVVLFIVSMFYMMVFCWQSDSADWTVEPEVLTGISYFNVKDSPTQAGKYLPVKNKNEINGFFRGNVNLWDKEGSNLSIYGQYYNPDQYRFGADFYSPRLKIDIDYKTFYSFLNHDPLINYYIVENPNDPKYQPPPGPATGSTMRKVWKDDFASSETYGIKRSSLNMGLSFDAVKDTSLLITPYFRFASENRVGHAQAISLSMCSACHIQGRTRSIDDRTNDVTAGVTFATEKNFVSDISFFYRKFNVSAAEPRYKPDSIYSPFDISTWGSYTVPNYTNFTNGSGARLFYGGKEIPYDNIPEYQKYGPNIEFSIPLSKVSNLYIHGVYSYTESDYNDIRSKFIGAGAAFSSTPFINSDLPMPLKFMSLNVSARYENIDIDNSINAQRDALAYAYNNHILWDVGSATGQTNLTNNYNDALRQLVDSTASRDVYSVEANVSMPISQRNLLKLSYLYKYTDRDNFEVSNTTVHEVKALLRGSIYKNLSYRLNAGYDYIHDPFRNLHTVNEDTALATALLGKLGSYLNTNSYRRDSVTNQPKNRYLGRFELTYVPMSKVSFNWNIGYTYAENDFANDFDNKNYYTNLSVTYTPTPKTGLSLSYGYNRNDMHSTIWQSLQLESSGALSQVEGNYSSRVKDKIENHIVSFSVFHQLNEKISLDGTLIYQHSRGGFTSPGSGETDLGNEIDISALNKYSKLSYNIWEAALGAEYRITKNISLTGSASYLYTDDNKGYVFGDQTGQVFTCLFGVRWRGF